jgi:hypothetical protein
LISNPRCRAPIRPYNPAAKITCIEDTNEPFITQDDLDRILKLILDRIRRESGDLFIDPWAC